MPKVNYPNEDKVQEEVIKFIRELDEHAHIITNPQSKRKATVGQRMKDIRQGFVKGQSDIIILRDCTDEHIELRGLMLELKKKGVRIRKKRSKEYSDDKIANQAHYFRKYGSKFMCRFACGEEEAKTIIKSFYELESL